MMAQLLNPLKDISTTTASTTSRSTNSNKSNSMTPKRGRKHSIKFQRNCNGCLTCRRKKKKCDGLKPVCSRCLKSGHDCLAPPIKFFQCDIKGIKQTYTEIKPCVFNYSSSESAMSSPNCSPKSSLTSLCSSPDMTHDSLIPKSPFNKLGSKYSNHHLILHDLKMPNNLFIAMDYKLPSISSLPLPETSIPKHTILQSAYIEDTLTNQNLVPVSLLENLQNISKLNGDILIALDCYCCSLISNDKNLKLKYSHINFMARTQELNYELSQIEIKTRNWAAEIEISFHCLLLLIDNYKTKGFNSFTKHLMKIRPLLSELKEQNTYSISEVLHFLQYFEMTTTYAFGNSSLIEGDFGSKLSPSTSKELSLINPIIQIYAKIFKLSRALSDSQDFSDNISSVLLDAAYWENKLDSLSPVAVLSSQEETDLLFGLYKSVGKLLIYQLLYKMQSSSTKTRILVHQMKSTIMKLFNSPLKIFDKCLLIYPMFITCIDIYGPSRYNYFETFESLVKDTLKSPSHVTVSVILKEIWNLNPDGFSYVEWIKTSSDYFFAIN